MYDSLHRWNLNPLLFLLLWHLATLFNRPPKPEAYQSSRNYVRRYPSIDMFIWGRFVVEWLYQWVKSVGSRSERLPI